MKDTCRNIYYNARHASGYTQERWAEHIGVSVEAIRQYEAGIWMPGEDVVLKMAEISGQLILPYWHLTRKSRIAGAILPELDGAKGLPEAVLSLLIQIEEFQQDGLRKLCSIAADGKVDEAEAGDFAEALDQVSALVRTAYELSYAKE